MSESAPVRFDGQVVVVTGAGRGIGREHALLLGARGATVVVNDIVAKHAERTAEDIVAAGGTASAVCRSISDPVDAAAVVTGAHDRYGRVDAVLNNAGNGGPTGPIDGIDDETLHKIVDSHLLGSFYTARAAWPIMLAQGGGRIVFTSSGSAMGAAGSAAYSMAKAGLWGLTRTLAIDGAEHSIVVNAISPMGYTYGASLNPNEDTRRWMEATMPPELCSPAAVLLCHPDAPCTGEIISSAGGRVALIATVGVPGVDLGPTISIEALRDRWHEVVALEGGRPLTMSRDELAFFSGDRAF
ncbi:MAG: hypothetical protein JWL72_2657 [Ilumatobacteraceae bacterium]|nr:hypothetical protein [Ilumatobacteraceae bacterium]MCU1389319.1 hypothetical protein [Ilumatobacteraceae bacterium]